MPLRPVRNPEPTMLIADATLARGLGRLLPTIVPGAAGLAALRRLSAGATLETWSFDAVDAAGASIHPLILRRSPGGLRSSESVPLAVEAQLLRALGGGDVPVPGVVHTLAPEDELGDGFIMTRIDGETIPRRILRDDDFALIRPQLVSQFGAILAGIHRTDVAKLPALPHKPLATILARLRERRQSLARPSAFFEWAMRWLERNAPPAPTRLRLVHGDFRNGNLIVGPDGVRAVLDWEVAHLGDPAEDLAWLCLPPWRFGQLDRPVGGLGSRDTLLAAYAAAGGEPMDPQRVRYWEALGSMRWWMGCAGMFAWFDSGRDTSVERAMIARRVSESELDFLRLVAGRT
jgi:aminoglycoside phosphotransferase (APT) family kinase protein